MPAKWQARELAGSAPGAAVAPRNLPDRVIPNRIQPANWLAPLLAGSLAVTPGLIRIHLAHALEEILRVRLLNIGGFRPSAVALLRAPWSGTHGSLRPIRHGETLELDL